MVLASLFWTFPLAFSRSFFVMVSVGMIWRCFSIFSLCLRAFSKCFFMFFRVSPILTFIHSISMGLKYGETSGSSSVFMIISFMKRFSHTFSIFSFSKPGDAVSPSMSGFLASSW